MTEIMVCQKCGSDTIGTIDSREYNGLRMRKKKCKACGRIFRTFEILEGDLDYLTKQVATIEEMVTSMVAQNAR